jgi:HTH-type transcriptional regulator / antitoxin HigA
MYKVINTEEEYRSALAAVTELVLQDPEPGTTEADRLELLTLLVQDYERRIATIDLPDPIDAILFRMEQQNLKQKDLITIIGSKSKVSEILSRKRPLTLPMIRALNEELAIPATVLLRKPASVKTARPSTDRAATQPSRQRG